MQNVTALGPKCPFNANLLSALGIMHFTNAEIRETYLELFGDASTIPKARVFELLAKAYGFEPMPEEMGIFVSTLALDNEDETTVTWEEFEAGCDDIRATLEGVGKNATEFQSYEDLRAERFKHTRLRKDPMDKYKGPMTENMKVGWHEEEVFNERFTKKSCEETRYVDSMTKSHIDIF
eukprot:TRINITY_DN3872_c0_g1_i1.p2 TRINITY_DN3872_c0_g1~~TRINITY_DN3872_c0_g1_i1.p2  ORF type:complete len:179 (-),score=32.40 TRINITY_DN3872_c0_g1_i1:100-636(-)